MATLSLPLPRLTRWGVAVWTFNPLPVSMRSRGGDCKHQLEANLQTHWIESVLHLSNIQYRKKKKESMIISTSKGPTLSAFLGLFSSSWASAVQFCLLGDEEGFLVYPENCTFTASGKTLGFVLEKKQTLGPLWHHTSTELQVSAHAYTEKWSKRKEENEGLFSFLASWQHTLLL